MHFRGLRRHACVCVCLHARHTLQTSGRDVAMFKYVDQFFPEDKYNKVSDETHTSKPYN